MQVMAVQRKQYCCILGVGSRALPGGRDVDHKECPDARKLREIFLSFRRSRRVVL